MAETVLVKFQDIPGKFKADKSFHFNGREYDDYSEYNGNFYDYYRFLQGRPKLESSNKYNRERFTEALYDGDESFKGGTFDDLFEPFSDLSGVKEAEKKLSANKIWKHIATKFDELSTRRRARSQYDGDFDFDKRWDAEPYNTRTKKPSKIRIVKINIEASFNCGVSSGAINNFGAFVTAIINLLERNGVLAEIHACYTGYDFTDKSNNLYHMDLKVKNADEYMPLQKILRVFSSVWYRRAKFALIVASAENLSQEVTKGLGMPYRFSKAWEVKDDSINIYAMPTQEDQSKIIEELIQLVGN